MPNLNKCECGGTMKVMKTIRSDGLTVRMHTCNECHTTYMTEERRANTQAASAAKPVETIISGTQAAPSAAKLVEAIDERTRVWRAATNVQREAASAAMFAYEGATFGHTLSNEERDAHRKTGAHNFDIVAALPQR